MEWGEGNVGMGGATEMDMVTRLRSLLVERWRCSASDTIEECNDYSTDINTKVWTFNQELICGAMQYLWSTVRYFSPYGGCLVPIMYSVIKGNVPPQ